ncbi:MAG: excinuclease ABC subunit UvrC [Candidatus Omnitrophica bacterium]|nr:excinuclease ABC subunit UvrC [Candidatus Omnitrophota bacterium]
MDVKAKVKLLPLTSGVYLFKDKNDQIIYIGKAVSLRRRVESYFRGNQQSLKTDLLVEHICDVQFIPTHSEAEALILEASLVKQHQPKYNIELKDGKTYPYIQMTKEEYPLVSVVRLNMRKNKNIKADFYGPYVNPTLIREALGIIRRIFHFRSCESLPHKPCLDFHIGLCEAPCVGKISKQEYARNIRHVRLILEGKKDDLYTDLQQEMELLARQKNFEAAAKIRDQIRAIGALYSGTKDVNYFKEAEQLERAFGLERALERIECFDISNIMGQQSVGSMVSFANGKPDKSNYRRFRIKTVEGIDDFQSIAEIVRRRYSRLKKEGLAYPDLIMIDGGKGQLAAAIAVLKELGVEIPIISLAKREEEVFLPAKRNPILLSKESLGLKLLQRVRDEAHRFAITYHRKLRDKHVFGQ